MPEKGRTETKDAFNTPQTRTDPNPAGGRVQQPARPATDPTPTPKKS